MTSTADFRSSSRKGASLHLRTERVVKSQLPFGWNVSPVANWFDAAAQPLMPALLERVRLCAPEVIASGGGVLLLGVPWRANGALRLCRVVMDGFLMHTFSHQVFHR